MDLEATLRQIETALNRHTPWSWIALGAVLMLILQRFFSRSKRIPEANPFGAPNQLFPKTGASISAVSTSFIGGTVDVSIDGQKMQLDAQAAAKIMDLLRKKDVIGAIKELRACTGSGLKEAKDAVEEIQRAGLLRKDEGPK